MKKNILYSMLFAAMATFGLTNCGDKESEGLSSITSYAVLTLNGDDIMLVEKGSNFVDPGCTAIMAGEDVSDQVRSTSNLNTNVLGFYDIVYSVINPDGFPASASRKVCVVDRNSFASAYLSEAQYGSRHYYNLPVFIKDNGDGTFTIDDLAGGFYAYGRYPGYPYDFSLESTLKLNPDNTVELVECDGGNWYWGDPIAITSGTYDPETGTVTLIEDFDGTPMYVTLTK